MPEGRFVIEMTPIPDGNGARRGVVAEGSVGSRWAGRWVRDARWQGYLADVPLRGAPLVRGGYPQTFARRSRVRGN